MAIVPATALPGKKQMIDDEGQFSPLANSFIEELKQHCSARSTYMVVSIIGPQSGGKSTLLNTVFGTKFDVLDGTGGRKQTTKGIWISRCINPCMILMDVEGSDGKERKDNVLFERQAGLFALTVSDVLLLNMWFHDIGRNQGASSGLLKLIFQERVLITDAQKTRVVICIRDHDYKQCSARKTSDDIQATIMELWNEVHPDKIMTDYIDVDVMDFPHRSYEEEKFQEKCNNLAELLASTAASNQAEGQYYAAAFAHSSKIIWDLICKNKRLNAADHKVAMASHICDEFTKEIINSMVNEKEYDSVMGVEGNNLKEFNKLLSPFLESLLRKYDVETELLDKSVRDNKKEVLEANIFEKFKQTYDMRIQNLRLEIVSSAMSEVSKDMEKLKNPSDFTNVMVDRYMRQFNESCGEVHRLFQGVRDKNLEEVKWELSSKIQEAATRIKKQLDEKEMEATHQRELLELNQKIELERLEKQHAQENLRLKTNPFAEALVTLLALPFTGPATLFQGGASSSKK